ncbi:PH domain-containing protein [uncultured Brachybacterium sp.]|uniref:PH domain-containing protein n=1 Tax=uncultured Brachybacterium sp. TaxID=189680 RepID=UPI00262C02C9|nr:PH domain-containing protein [uncultured Brachybacterium sp.]
MNASAADRQPGEDRARIVLRPRAVRVAAYLSAAIVMAGMIGGAVLITSFQWGGRLGLVAVGVLVVIFCHLEASVTVTARPEVLVVRNLMSTRTLEWAEVIGISFPMGDPWAHLDLADGSTLALQAIQRYDGDRAIAAAHLLLRLVQERGEAVGD